VNEAGVAVPGPFSGIDAWPVAVPDPTVTHPDSTAFGSALDAEIVTLVTSLATFAV